MAQNPLIWIGLAGVDEDDNARARAWQQRLHGVMIGVALLALPAYLLDSAGTDPALHRVASVLDAVIFAAFLGETLWMLHVSNHPGRYVLENWLNVLIMIGAGASAFGATTEWVALVRVARVAVGSLVLVRTMAEFRVLFTRRGAPLLVGAASLIMMTSGGVLYWLEPTVTTYWDGLWLAFVTGTTVGYGDLVPTTPAARMFAVFIALVGVALMTLFTANVVAFFIGHGEPAAREDTLLALREALAREGAEARAASAALRDELRAVQEEIAALRSDLARSCERKPGEPPPGPLT